MADYADLEIGLHHHRWRSEYCTVELRFRQPDGDGGISPVSGRARFDLKKLREQGEDMEAYGRILTSNLFADPNVLEAFIRARVISAQTPDPKLRVRLFIGESAPELNDLRWETLRDPERDTAPLLTNENILFSRYLSLTSLDWRPVNPRRKKALQALVVIANPNPANPTGRWPLTPVNVQDELVRAQKGLGGNISITPLASGGAATLDNMIAQLREGCDILYLVCHGALIKGEPYLWLENKEGDVAVVEGSDLVARLGELTERPRLVVLASCESAGTGQEPTAADGSALVALGPRLAEAGIPAVLAMQGQVTMSTVGEFMPAFFRELQKDGQIDRAMTVARGEVRDRPDYWMPVLFMRLKSGSIWYVPGFEDFEQWPALLTELDLRRCTPILGSGLLDELIGSTRDLAQNWAKEYNFPMASYAQDNLPQVAQYLATNYMLDMPNIKFDQYVRDELSKRFDDKLPRNATIDPLLTAAGKILREQNPKEPHKVLANLYCPIYVTANPDNLLRDALIEAGKSPRVELCRWKRKPDPIWPTSVFDADPDYVPTVEEPLVYHLFGHVEYPDTVVLKEDDYFEYLTKVAGDRTAGVAGKVDSLIHPIVWTALTDKALLFLGFRIDDWDFRALYQSLMVKDGGRRGSHAHVAAQFSPEEDRNLDPRRARRYLQRYFDGGYPRRYFDAPKIDIYWGSLKDFVEALQSKWDDEHPESTPPGDAHPKPPQPPAPVLPGHLPAPVKESEQGDIAS